MNKNLSYFSESFQLLIRHWQIFAIALAPGLVTSLASLAGKVPLILNLFVFLWVIGWYGTQIEFFKAAKETGKLPIGQFKPLMVKYIKKLIVLGFLLSVITGGFYMIAYQFLVFKEGGKAAEIFLNMSKNPFNPFSIISSIILAIVGTVGATAVSAMALKKENVDPAVNDAINFIKRHLDFFGVVLFIQLVLYILRNGGTPLLSAVEPQLRTLILFLVNVPFTFLMSVIFGAVLLYCLKTDQKS